MDKFIYRSHGRTKRSATALLEYVLFSTRRTILKLIFCFSFPAAAEIRDRWLAFIERNGGDLGQFHPEDVTVTAVRRNLNRMAVPTVGLEVVVVDVEEDMEIDHPELEVVGVAVQEIEEEMDFADNRPERETADGGRVHGEAIPEALVSPFFFSLFTLKFIIAPFYTVVAIFNCSNDLSLVIFFYSHGSFCCKYSLILYK